MALESSSEREEPVRPKSRLRSALDIDTVGAIFFDLDGWLLDANDAFLAMSGYSRQDLESGGLNWRRLTPAEWMEASNRAFEELKATGRTTPYEKEYFRKDGSRWWALFAAKLLPDGTGFELVIDITARKVEEARRLALLDLTDRFRELTDASDISFAAAEMLGRLLAVSRAGYGTVDKVTETITIERDWNAPGVKSLAGVLRFRDYGSYIEDLKRGETVVFADAEKDPRTAANADALKAISAQAVVNMPVTEQGDLVALLYLNHEAAREWPADELVFVRDVAERTRTAVERRRAEQELQALAASLERQVAERTAERDRVWHNSRDLLVVVGADGIFRAVNPAWTKILGHKPDDVVGRSFLDFIWHEDATLTQAGLDRAAAASDLTNFENRYRDRNGQPRWISWHTSVEGDLVYAYGRDITTEKERQIELERTQDALRQAQKMEAVGQLTGGIAHDFNNLLTGIVGSLDMLQRRLAEGRLDSLPRYSSAAMTSAKRAAALTQRLLAFSRRQPLDPKIVEPNRLLASMEDLLRRTLGPSIELEMVLAGGLWPTLCDANQLESTILNLAINARDAMSGRGRLTIETANAHLDEAYARSRGDGVSPGQYVSMAVTDTGAGIPGNLVERIFEPFFTTKPLGEGTGLGLSQVYGFVKQSGGHVAVYTEEEQGTTFRVYLPRFREAPAQDDAAEHVVDLPQTPAVGVVLVVEDEAAIRMLITETLQDLGFSAVEAVDGREGLRILQSAQRVDLLVTDVGLPGLNGRQLADAGRKLRPNMQVLFITGFAGNAAVGNGLLEPGMQILTKPFSMDQLATKILTMAELSGLPS